MFDLNIDNYSANAARNCDAIINYGNILVCGRTVINSVMNMSAIVYADFCSALEGLEYSSGTTFKDAVKNLGEISGGLYYGGLSNITENSVTGTVKSVEITYMADSENEYAKYVLPQAGTTLMLPSPKKEGYVFAGWFNGENGFDFTKDVSSTTTLTAHRLAASNRA